MKEGKIDERKYIRDEKSQKKKRDFLLHKKGVILWNITAFIPDLCDSSVLDVPLFFYEEYGYLQYEAFYLLAQRDALEQLHRRPEGGGFRTVCGKYHDHCDRMSCGNTSDLIHGGLCLFQGEMEGPGSMLCHDPDHHDAALLGDTDSAVYDLAEPESH